MLAGVASANNTTASWYAAPDPYELSSPKEFIAVNMEYFLLDPSYACRRPALNHYLREHFGWAPQQSACEKSLPFLNAGNDFARQPLGEIDPERVYEVDYLLAEANQNWVSRWGHSMLRLVICAPGRPRGPDCRLTSTRAWCCHTAPSSMTCNCPVGTA